MNLSFFSLKVAFAREFYFAVGLFVVLEIFRRARKTKP